MSCIGCIPEATLNLTGIGISTTIIQSSATSESAPPSFLVIVVTAPTALAQTLATAKLAATRCHASDVPM